MIDYRGYRFGNYRLIGLLGKGGYAHVYLGEQIFLKTQAAIKVLDEPLGDEKVEQFRLEAGTIGHLDHPHIVRLLDYGVEHNVPYVVMDYAPNGTLRQRHPQGVPVPLAQVVRYVQHVAAALDYAHQHKIIHRDVKPENLLLGRKQEVLLSDFGIAVVAHQTESMPTQNEVGTIGYTAPEQLRKRPHPASDQYSLAIVVYEWLTGTPPFHGSAIQIAIQHLQMPPPPLRQPGSALPADVERVVLKALEKDRHLRFASLREFAIALQEASTPHPPVAHGLRVDLPLVSPAPADPLDLVPTAVPPVPASTPEGSETAPTALPEQETWHEERHVGEPAPGDPQGEQPTDPATTPPPRRPPDVHHSEARHLKRRTARLALAALLLIVVLGVSGLLIAQGAPSEVMRILSGSTASHTPGGQPGTTPAPGASGIPTGNTTTPPATSTTPSSSGTPTVTSTTPGSPGVTPTSTPPAGGSPTATTPPPRLSVSPTSLTFLLQIVNCALTNHPQTLTIQNSGGGELSWSATIQNPAYLSIDQSHGTLGPSGTSQIRVTATCGLTVNQTDQITFTSNGGTVTVSVTITLS